jgi:hypothetical protein
LSSISFLIDLISSSGEQETAVSRAIFLFLYIFSGGETHFPAHLPKRTTTGSVAALLIIASPSFRCAS